MKRDEIYNKLRASHDKLLACYSAASMDDLTKAPAEKWDMTEHMIHLSKSMAPLTIILRKPKFFVRWSFGKANRPSKSYEGLVQRYQERLAQNTAGAPSPFVPKAGENREKSEVISRYKKEMLALEKACSNWKEEHMDTYILPHPLLGKVTLREMMYFMDHHTLHHMAIMKRNVESV